MAISVAQPQRKHGERLINWWGYPDFVVKSAPFYRIPVIHMNPPRKPSYLTASTSLPPTHFRSAPGVQLLPAEMELLAQAFADTPTIFVKQEFRSGYSGALVLLISLGADRAPVVVKLGHPIDLWREYDAYEKFVRQISPQTIAHLQGEPLISSDAQLGMIQYSFAGGESNQAATSLSDYYELNGGNACAEVLNRIFRTFGRYWWANNRLQVYTLGEQYDRLLPVHLQVAKAVPNGESSQVLETGRTSVLALRTIEVGQYVRLVGFKVTKVRANGRKMTLMASPPPTEASAPLRVRLELDEGSDLSLSYQPGDVVEGLDVVVVATRQTLLRDAATTALPSFDANTKAFTADIGHLATMPDGARLLNPLYDLSGLLDYVLETKSSVIHGDLNLQNILVDVPTGFAWIIDFGETGHGPTLLDLQRLEVQVATKLLPSALQQAQLDLAALVDLFVALHADPPPPMSPHAALQEPYLVLATIRRLARQYLTDDLNWDEYYLGLVVTLVGALKYDELETLARRTALVTAAIVRGLIGHRLVSGYATSSRSLSPTASPVVAVTDGEPQQAREPLQVPPQQAPVTAPLQHLTARKPLQRAAAKVLPQQEPIQVAPKLAAPSRGRYLGMGAGLVVTLLAILMGWQLWSRLPQPSPPRNSVSVRVPAASQATATSESSSGIVEVAQTTTTVAVAAPVSTTRPIPVEAVATLSDEALPAQGADALPTATVQPLPTSIPTRESDGTLAEANAAQPLNSEVETAPATPEIRYFRANEPVIRPGGQVILSWDVTNASAVFLRTGGTQEGVAAPGTKSIYPTGTTVYELVAQNNNGESVVEITVEVSDTFTPIPPLAGVLPQVDYFRASQDTIRPGDMVILSWDARHAYSGLFLRYNGSEEGAVAPGTKVVYPSETTTY